MGYNGAKSSFEASILDAASTARACSRVAATSRPQAARLHVVVCIFEGGGFSILFTATLRTRKEFLSRQSLLWLKGRTIGALRAERHTMTSAE